MIIKSTLLGCGIFVFSLLPGLLIVSNVSAETNSMDKSWPLVPNLGPDACGPLRVPNRHGPFDYRNPPPEAIIWNVEQNHFNQRLRAMRKGKDTYSPSASGETFSGDAGGHVAGGFSYTLLAFPNHARALQAMDEYSRRKGFAAKPTGAEYSVECFFERAIRFAPNDPVVRFLYADFLQARGRRADAEREIKLIHDEAAASPSLAYNVGLFYAKRGDGKTALEYARVAYAGGFDLPGLKNLLVKLKHWDPEIDNLVDMRKKAVSTTIGGKP